jgi:hypothetical protein
MKKILLSAVMLTALSFASFADEVKVKEVKTPEKTGVKEAVEKKSDPGVDCYAGMTSCGEGYMVCFSEPVTRNITAEIALWDKMDSLLC